MECPLFYTTALINDYAHAKALIDQGSAAYALISKKRADRLNLPLLDIPHRRIQGAQGTNQLESKNIAYVTTFSLDIGAHKTAKVFAYVVPDLSEELILGRL